MDPAGTLRTLLLLGGGEWHRAAEEPDRWWLARAARPRVTVVTSAAQDIPATQVRWAAAHFGEMGASVDGCQIQTHQDAHDPRLLGQLRNAASIYLCGGDPGAAREVLVDSPAGELLITAYRAGIPVAGSSAGAMVLGSDCLVPGQDFALRRGLGLVPALVVPHWSDAGPRWRQVVERLAREHQVLALDESTGLCWDGLAWATRGPGRAVLVTPSGEQEMGEGQPLPPLE
ncbi:MAG: Type 1 glutamine amidotransferase-like domain-containing protein [Candidatus Dormiibacterota bacterium]|jgi:cyanophycinase